MITLNKEEIIKRCDKACKDGIKRRTMIRTLVSDNRMYDCNIDIDEIDDDLLLIKYDDRQVIAACIEFDHKRFCIIANEQDFDNGERRDRIHFTFGTASDFFKIDRLFVIDNMTLYNVDEHEMFIQMILTGLVDQAM